MAIQVFGMAEMIPFPLYAREKLVGSMTDGLEAVHGPAANVYWRERIASIVSDLRALGLADAAIRCEIVNLQDAVQAEMHRRAGLNLPSSA